MWRPIHGKSLNNITILYYPSLNVYCTRVQYEILIGIWYSPVFMQKSLKQYLFIHYYNIPNFIEVYKTGCGLQILYVWTNPGFNYLSSIANNEILSIILSHVYLYTVYGRKKCNYYIHTYQDVKCSGGSRDFKSGEINPVLKVFLKRKMYDKMQKYCYW